MNGKSDSSDGKAFYQQTVSFHLHKSQQQLTSFYGQIPFPTNLDDDFEVLRVNQVDKDGALKLVDPRYIWISNTYPVK